MACVSNSVEALSIDKHYKTQKDWSVETGMPKLLKK